MGISHKPPWAGPTVYVFEDNNIPNIQNNRALSSTLGIDPKSLHTTVLMQTVYNAVVWHSGRFLNYMVISVTEKGRITVA